MSTSGKKERERPSPPPLQLCILDTRRGQQEGQEGEKVLAFYPEATPTDDRTSVVGLFLATNVFCSIFSQVHMHPAYLSCRLLLISLSLRAFPIGLHETV